MMEVDCDSISRGRLRNQKWFMIRDDPISHFYKEYPTLSQSSTLPH